MSLDFTEEELEFINEGWIVEHHHVGVPIVALNLPLPDFTKCTSEAQSREILDKYLNRRKRKVEFMTSLPQRLKESQK